MASEDEIRERGICESHKVAAQSVNSLAAQQRAILIIPRGLFCKNNMLGQSDEVFDYFTMQGFLISEGFSFLYV